MLNRHKEKHKSSMAISLYFLLTLLSLLTYDSNACPPSDRAALLAFKSALHEPHIGIFNSWKGTNCCHNWYGISCDPVTYRVASITLRGISHDPTFAKSNHTTGHMTGSISPAICYLTRLSSLTITHWKGISGKIPPCISKITSLQILDLMGNQLSGEIPPQIGQLIRLTIFIVADNQLSGSIPISLTNLSSLTHLDIRENKFSGPIPTNLGKLKKLKRALLSQNSLTGPIPDSISTIYQLSDLDLSINKLTGQIPPSLGKMPVLATLNLDRNLISGQIPPSLISSRIAILNLSTNAIVGHIPDMFGPRSYFTVIDLSYNKLKGKIPKSMTSAAYIGHLDVSHNHLCGKIPEGSPFDHMDASSFAYNDCLCGKPLVNNAKFWVCT